MISGWLVLGLIVALRANALQVEEDLASFELVDASEVIPE